MISLVTACMNRESHLRRSLPVWLKLPAIDEIVLVDWSTREPFDDLLTLDPRIRILRAEGEPRWILAYAYNLGIAEAKGDVILKCDADCLPSDAVVALQPSAGRFFAGDWRTGNLVGKTCVNGQCLFTREQWSQVNGYSELMRRYGHDDSDLYSRLERAGHARQEIIPELLDFCPHTEADRVANHSRPEPDDPVEAFLHSQTAFHESFNMLIAGMLPWGVWFQRAKFEHVEESARKLVVRRVTSQEIPISAPLQQLARSQSIRVMTSRLCKLPFATLAGLGDAECLAKISYHLRLLSNQGTFRNPPRVLPSAAQQNGFIEQTSDRPSFRAKAAAT